MMAKRVTGLWCGGVIMLLCLVAGAGYAQQIKAMTSPVDIRRLDGGSVDTPVFAVKGYSSSASPEEWFRAYVEYDSEPDWLDELSFTFYVILRGKTKDAPPVSLLKEEVTYQHIASGKKHQADIFVHPNILSRFGEVELVAVEIRRDGLLLARAGKPSPPDAWWDRIAQGTLGVPVTGMLTRRDQSPFALVEIDQHEMIKPK